MLAGRQEEELGSQRDSILLRDCLAACFGHDRVLNKVSKVNREKDSTAGSLPRCSLERYAGFPKPGPTERDAFELLECRMAPGPMADGGGTCIKPAGFTTDAGFTADIQMRIL